MAEKEGLNKSLKLLAKTSVIVFIGIVLSKILAYAYRIIIAREFGPETYGLFSLALMISGWFISISALGLSDGILRFIPLYRGKKDNEKTRFVFKFAIGVISITSIISAIILYFLAETISVGIFHDERLIIFLKIISFVIPFTALSYPFLSALRAFEKIKEYSFSFNILQNALKVVFLLMFIVLGYNSPNSVVLSYVLAILGMLIASYWLCRTKISSLFDKKKIEKSKGDEVLKQLFNYSIPILFFGIIYSIFYWIDSFSIGYYKSALEVGLYNAAVPIAMGLMVIPEIFMQLFFPLITREYAKNRISLIRELSKQINKWIFAFNAFILIMLLVFPGAFINILFGKSYIGAENALRILALGNIVLSLSSVPSNLLLMLGKSKTVMINMLLASILNIILNAWLIPKQSILGLDNSLGINGAAIATVISIIFMGLLFSYTSRKAIDILPFRRKMAIIALVAIVLGGALHYVNYYLQASAWTNLGIIILSFFAYLGLMIISRSLDRHDWVIVKETLKKIMGK